MTYSAIALKTEPTLNVRSHTHLHINLEAYDHRIAFR